MMSQEHVCSRVKIKPFRSGSQMLKFGAQEVDGGHLPESQYVTMSLG